MTEWLTNRLSPVKAETQRWMSLSTAIQSYWESYSDPHIRLLTELYSAFTAGPYAIALMRSHLERFFESDLLEDNIPLALSWRRMELPLKYSTVLLQRLLQRAGADFEYRPLWGREDFAYGEYTFIDPEIWPIHKLDGTWTLNGSIKLYPRYYLTSRGVIVADLNALQNYGDIDYVARRFLTIKPLHIVWDGFRYLGSGHEIVISVKQPKLDGSWRVLSPAMAQIKIYPDTHDDILARASASRIVFGASILSLYNETALNYPCKWIDNGPKQLQFIGGMPASEGIEQTIAAAGLRIGNSLYGAFVFLPKTKTQYDSYSITITLDFE